jgi:glutathione S-transferase
LSSTKGRQLGSIEGGPPNVRKVRLLAAELGIPLEHVTLDITKGEYSSPEYLAKNPNATVAARRHRPPGPL